jgi:hypothetical protein
LFDEKSKIKKPGGTSPLRIINSLGMTGWLKIMICVLRLISINGTDVRHCKISQASDLIKVGRFEKWSSFKATVPES